MRAEYLQIAEQRQLSAYNCIFSKYISLKGGELKFTLENKNSQSLQHLHKESASSKRKMILGEKSKMQEE
jgi:hypothetical protein